MPRVAAGLSSFRSGLSIPVRVCDTPVMNAFFSAVMILWIFGMVIYLTKDM
jgi:hypothetical protein